MGKIQLPRILIAHFKDVCTGVLYLYLSPGKWHVADDGVEADNVV